MSDKYLSSFLFAAGLLLSFQACAENKPIVGTYKKDAWCFDQRGYGADQSDKWRPCKKKQYDKLSISRREDLLYQVDFSFTQFASTAGTCELSGVFRLDNNVLTVSETDKELTEEGCIMQIVISPDEFKFSDRTQSCNRMHCGRNQSIDGEVFPRGLPQ